MDINQVSHLIVTSELSNKTNDDSNVPISNSKSSSKLPFLNLFKDQNISIDSPSPPMFLISPLQTSATNDINDLALLEYSSESMLANCLAGNFELVREILQNGDFNLNLNKRFSSGKKSEDNRYNTITGGQGYAFKIDLEITDDVKQTPLILAARFGYTNIAAILIEYGAKVNSVDMDAWTPLLNAAKDGNHQLVEILLDNKAFIESRDSGGFTPLMWACYKNKLDCVKVLISNGANVNAQCKNTVSCLSWASGRGYTQIVHELLRTPNAKINLQDRNSSTPLLWAARKGVLEIVNALVESGANPDAIGMHNMTPLIMACKNGHLEAATYLAKLNDTTLNHLDKDGQSALGYACKNGHTDLALILLEKGAYVNIPNKKGDTVLITAVKGNHTEIIDALISRHVEIDAIGNQGKTALHHAIEKGNVDVVRSILTYKPYLEVVAQDGDTLLLLAVKRKCSNIVSELLNNGSKVSPTDKNGDNVLHISLRNRSKDITELILANPKNSKYLYKPNKCGETPHKIDASNPKSILTQIFGARQLNMTEDSILGYDLYSSALSEILSEPSLHTPITVGLYAKWGSGKSFLLNQLKAEMKSFARLTRVVYLKLNAFLVMTVLLLNLVLATPFLFWKWPVGLGVFAVGVVLSMLVIFLSKFYHERKERGWAEHLCNKISTQISRFKLLLQVLFLNPHASKNLNSEHKNLHFIFTDYGKISTIGGENALALMVSGLWMKMEDRLGLVVTRLCRVFYNRSHVHDKFKKFCCIPTFILVALVIVFTIATAVFLRVKGFDFVKFSVEEKAFVGTLLFIVGFSVLGSSVTWVKIFWNLVRSPKSRIRSIHMAHSSNNEAKIDPKVESFILKLKREVDLMAHTVKTIDAFSHSCTRLVIIIDGLDSCEQSKVVQILEIIHVLFTREGDPFISILAVDPHVLIKGIEGNLTEAFRNGSVNGNDYLRTIIHLPVFLQVDLSRAKALTKAPVFKKSTNVSFKGSQDVLHTKKFDSDVTKNRKKRGKGKSGTSAKPMSAYDLTDQLIKSDYFLDVNPRNLRRLINIIALTGRLLRAYHIDFNWRLLASWIYLNEQWPYRCSWIIMYYDEHESEFDDEATLNEVYERIKHQIPISNEPLLEMDRNARKFEQFIQNCKPALTVQIFKKLLPCTCNLDPYLIKLIKDSIDAFHDKFDRLNQLNNLNSNQGTFNPAYNANLTFPSSFNPNILATNTFSGNSSHFNHNIGDQNALIQNLSSSKLPAFKQTNSVQETFNMNSYMRPITASKAPETKDLNWSSNEHLVEININKPLREMSVSEVIEEIDGHIDFLNEDYKQVYKANLKDHNINGRVLACCDLAELKSELQMTFGDWQLFKDWITKQRAQNMKMVRQRKRQRVEKFADEKFMDSNLLQKSVRDDNFNELKQQALNLKKEKSLEAVVVPTPESKVKNSNEAEHQSGRSSRKVEFFITPVVEANGLEKRDSVFLMSKHTSTSSIKSNSEETVSKIGKKLYGLFNKDSSRMSGDRTPEYELVQKSETQQTLLSDATDDEEESGSNSASGGDESNDSTNEVSHLTVPKSNGK